MASRGGGSLGLLLWVLLLQPWRGGAQGGPLLPPPSPAPTSASSSGGDREGPGVSVGRAEGPSATPGPQEPDILSQLVELIPGDAWRWEPRGGAEACEWEPVLGGSLGEPRGSEECSPTVESEPDAMRPWRSAGPGPGDSAARPWSLRGRGLTPLLSEGHLVLSWEARALFL